MELSYYSVNEYGVLVLNTLPNRVDGNGNRIPYHVDDFQLEYTVNERNVMVIHHQYEVMTVGKYGLMHGKPVAEMLGLNYVRVGRCMRAFRK